MLTRYLCLRQSISIAGPSPALPVLGFLVAEGIAAPANQAPRAANTAASQRASVTTLTLPAFA
jgi:hypothetical protein